MPPSWSTAPWFLPLAAALHVVLAIGFAALLPRLFDTPPRRRAALASLGAAALWTALCLGPWRAAWPAGWLTLLQEGFTGDTLLWMTGHGLHGGPLMSGFWQRVLPHDVLHVRDVVAVNRWAMGLHTLLLAHIVFRVAPDKLLAGLLVVAYVISPLFLNTATSSQPGAITGVYLLLTVVPAWSAWSRPTWLRVALLAILGLLVAAVRVELAGFALTALVVVVAQAVAPQRIASLSTFGERIRAWVAAHPRRAALALAAFVVVAPLVSRIPALWVRPTGQTAWFLYAIHPLNVAWATLPVILLAAVPFGLVALVVRGHLLALRHPLMTGGVALSSVIIYQAYWAAAHGLSYFPTGQLGVIELYRYCGMLLPMWVVLAAAALPTSRAPITRALWVVALLAPAMPQATRLLPQHLPWQDARVAPLPAWGLIDTDVTRQARALVALTDAHPDCALLTRSRDWRSSPESPVVQDLLYYPRQYARARGLITWPTAQGLGLDRLQAEHLWPRACVLVLEPLDGDLANHQVPIDDLATTGEILVEARFPTRPQVFAHHTGGWAGSTQGFRVRRLVLPPEVRARLNDADPE